MTLYIIRERVYYIEHMNNINIENNLNATFQRRNDSEFLSFGKIKLHYLSQV